VKYFLPVQPLRRAAHCRVTTAHDCAGETVRMLSSAIEQNRPTAAAQSAGLLSRILATCLDLRSVWSLGHDCSAQEARRGHDLLLFADWPTLRALRKSNPLHRAEVQVLVVIDGDRFENVWGPHRVSGSIARWAWRPVASDVAYYDESRWVELAGAERTVARVRRKALLVWPRLAAR
jgi:hypothetical protein